MALLPTCTGLLALQGNQGALGVILAIKILNEEMLEVVVRGDAEQYPQNYVETFCQSAQIPNKIENAVHVSIDPVKSQIKFKRNGKMQ